MKKRSFFTRHSFGVGGALVFFGVAFFACQQTEKAEKAAAPNADLAALFEKHYDENAALFPFSATVNGDFRFNNSLPNDGTQAFRDSCRRFYAKNLAAIQKFDRSKLTADDQTSFDIFKREMEMSLEGLSYPDWQIPITQFDGLHLAMGQMGSGDGAQPFAAVKDYDEWLSRCRAFPSWADTAISNFRKGMASGWTLPRACVVKLIPQLRDLAEKEAEKSIFWGPMRKFPADAPMDQKARVASDFKNVIQKDLAPSFSRLADFLQNEYLPVARTTSGVGAMPGGDKFYDWTVRYWTTTDRSGDAIFETGKAEVARIHAEMEKIKTQVGFRGDLPAFFTFLKTDKQFFPFKTAEEVLDSFRRIYKIIEPNVEKAFNLKPKCPFEIRRTEAFREASASAEYNQGTPDGKRPGIFYTPVPDATKFATTSGMESLFLHEAIPGHHFQVMLQMENEKLPKFRRFSWYGAYGEGWALYTESIGEEMGLYRNPYQKMGALGDEIHRAIRLVVDVGLHQKGWTREQVIQYFLENESMSEDYAIMETERYMATPAQALSYKTGSMFIRELRARYEKKLGPKFSLARFHDEMLNDGCLPLSVLEAKMERWASGF